MAHLSGDKTLLATPSKTAKTYTAAPPPKCSASPPKTWQQRAAPLRQNHQLRPDLRHGQIRPRQIAGHRQPRLPKSFIDRDFARYPAWPSYMQRTKSSPPRKATSQTVLGRRLYSPGIHSKNGNERARRRTRRHQRPHAGHRFRFNQTCHDKTCAIGSLQTALKAS